GGYLIWALPEQKVFIDSRMDVFDWTGVLGDYRRWAAMAEDPQRLLDKYGVAYCLLPKDSPMSLVLSYLPGWRNVYNDGVASIFVRSGPLVTQSGDAIRK
ncbi:MAG TPA: hypothetical protein VEU62_21285, partial [Bryobacterales bacterium]|nr:hypothetical protein [Bryobacterales bacterium]